MSKNINWDSMYKGAMRGLHAPRGAKYGSRKEQVSQAFEQMAKAQKAQAEFNRIEPLLKQSLLEHMVSRTPIMVERPMGYYTEELRKAQEMDEIDRAYYNRPTENNDPGTYEIVQKSIEPGTTLTFVRSDAQLGQWLFKASDGRDIEIYDKPVIQLGRDRVVSNPGFWGLLTSTNIYREVLEAQNADQE